MTLGINELKKKKMKLLNKTKSLWRIQ